jgi:hypothetical protein
MEQNCRRRLGGPAEWALCPSRSPLSPAQAGPFFEGTDGSQAARWNQNMVSGNGTSIWPLGGRMARILHETLLLCSMAAFVVGVVIAAASLLG